MNKESIICDLVQKGFWVKATGSRVTNHFTKDSDWDYVVFDPNKKLDKMLNSESGWQIGGSGNGKEFNSWKIGTQQETVNLILVDKEDIWKKYIIATNIIKAVNPKTKEERIKIFDNVFGKTVDVNAVTF